MAISAQGLDVSNWQPPLTTAMIAGKKFVFCKATEALNFIDPHFEHNWDFLAGQHGVYRGAYHFYHPSLPAMQQAAFFMSVVHGNGLRRGDILIIDAEIATGLDGSLITGRPAGLRPRSNLVHADSTGRIHNNPGVSLPHRFLRRSLPPKMDASLVGSGALDFLDYVYDMQHSIMGGNYCPVMCYTYMDFLPQLAPCVRYLLYIADYATDAPSSVAPWPSWKIWQWAGGGGPGGADQDAYDGNDAAMDTWMRFYADPAPAPPPKPPAPNWTETLMGELPQLQQGATGDDVKSAQGLLCARGYLTSIDGAFGPKTKSVVQQLQSSHGITVDGVIGPQTWAKLLNR